MKRLLPVVLVLAGCVPGATPAPSSPSPSGACAPTDQDQYVYHPTRLTVLSPCAYAAGTVAAMRQEADGDFHVLVALDPPYAGLVNAANSGVELGDLVVESICVLPVTQADAVGSCKADPDPISVTGMAVGQHVWVTGRYVTDGAHGGWAEFHPLYGWGLAPGSGLPLPAQTPGVPQDEAP